jgi:hypothetical protein
MVLLAATISAVARGTIPSRLEYVCLFYDIVDKQFPPVPVAGASQRSN